MFIIILFCIEIYSQLDLVFFICIFIFMRYATEEERQNAKRLAWKKYRETHRKERVESTQRTANKELAKLREKERVSTKKGRADSLIRNYKSFDKRTNRGECTLTQEYILNYIFDNTCIYCGESDWKQLGCDRIDNSKPHTPDNCVCSCSKCNIERKRQNFYKFLISKSYQR